jgi:hypothetical protein
MMMTRLRRRLLGTGEGEEVAGLLLQGSGPGGQGEGLFGGDGGDQGVAGQGGEVGEQGAEAVDRQAVPGSPGGLLGDGGGGALGLGDDAGAQRLGRLRRQGESGGGRNSPAAFVRRCKGRGHLDA